MTLNEHEWEEVEHLVNGEYMTQVEDAGFEAALVGVKLAIAILQACPIQAKSQVELRHQALDYLSQYGLYDEAPIKDILTKEDLHALHVKQYGSEEEAPAQERYDTLFSLLTPEHGDHIRLWYQDAQKIWHMLESSWEGYRWKFYYEQGTDPVTMQKEGSTDYLYNWSFQDLLHTVHALKMFDVYDVPVEQWYYAPVVKEN